MKKIEDFINKDIKKVAVTGHERPDGDCAGSVLGLYNYLSDNFRDLTVKPYLEEKNKKYSFMNGFDKTDTGDGSDFLADMVFVLDCADSRRVGAGKETLSKCGNIIVVDHHISNKGFGAYNTVMPQASSTAEVLCGLMSENLISCETAKCLYTGIIHDTGVFSHSNTLPDTFTCAAMLLKKGIDARKIIDDTFYAKTYIQNQILGRALLESFLLFEGKCIFSSIKLKDIDFYKVSPSDFDGIVEQMLKTEGVAISVFAYEMDVSVYKVSLRSKGDIDVCRIASYFGGGGHKNASGCVISGSIHDAINNLSKQISLQLH